ncbi:unnamed protein product [Mytilus edulis]|uniref:DUF6589 domain-containing protein n=1 Tax=Mytilus edulis TaxID=6550 RepID=A0A8S3QBS9_MYTED|nr:unnamed protein product [Mytilus edulis]
MQGICNLSYTTSIFKRIQKKSCVIPLGILEKDENKTEEMIEIIEHLQQYTPKAHDKMMPLLMGGDGLSVEREGAQRARADGISQEDRLEDTDCQIDRILTAEARRRNTQMSCLTEVPSIPKDDLLQKYSDGNAVYIKDLNVKLKHCLDHWKSQSSNPQLPVKNPTIQEFIKTQQWPNLTVSVVKDVGRTNSAPPISPGKVQNMDARRPHTDCQIDRILTAEAREAYYLNVMFDGSTSIQRRSPTEIFRWKCCVYKDLNTNSAPPISPGKVQSMDAGRPTNSASHSLPRTQEAAAKSSVKAYILEDVSFPVRSKFSPEGKSLKYTVWAIVDNKICQIATFKEKKAQQLNRDEQIKFIKIHYDTTYGYMIRPDTVVSCIKKYLSPEGHDGNLEFK